MTDTTAATALLKQNYDREFYIDFIRKSRYSKYMGTGRNNPIVLREDLTKTRGDTITLALVNSLSGAGVTGSSTLEGNEEAMDTRSMAITVDQFRNAVRVPMLQEMFTEIELIKAAREDLLLWRLDKHKDDMDDALASINGTAYGSASEANKDAWLVDNDDRTVFGDITGSGLSDHSAALSGIASTEELVAANVSLMKRVASTASPAIRPWHIEELDEEMFVLFVTPHSMRDLKNEASSPIAAANREARNRGLDNPIFTGGALLYDGIIIQEIPEQTTTGAVGTCSAQVDPAYLLGQSAVCYAVAKRPELVTEIFDYGDKNGVAVREVSDLRKVIFGSGASDTDDLKDHGVVTGYFAAATD